MIDLTPLEIRQKKGDFRRTLRGYDRELVDDFLDLAADRLEQLVRENMERSSRIEALEEELAGFREREQSLTEALVAAQEAREDMRRQARKDADLIRREAEVEADRIRSEAGEARQKEQEAVRNLRARRAQLVRSYRTFLERELGELATLQETLQLEKKKKKASSEKRRTVKSQQGK